MHVAENENNLSPSGTRENNRNSERTENDGGVRTMSVTASFALPAGSYATVFLREVMNNDDFF